MKENELTKGETITTKDERKFTRLLGGFGDSKPMFTIWQSGELLGLSTKAIKENYDNNINNFENGIDFKDLKSALDKNDSEKIVDITRFLKDVGYSQNKLNATKQWLIFSYSGMMKLVKIATSKESWSIYNDFLEDYFKTKAENIVMKKTLEEELEYLKELRANALGKMFMESDSTKKMELFNENEKLNKRMTEIEKSMKEEEIIKKLKSDLDVAKVFTDNKGYFDIGTFSKIIKVKNLGRNNLFSWMRYKEILMSNNQPYQRYIDYFKVLPIENKYTHRIDYKTMIRANGVKYIIKKLVEDGKVITKSIDEIVSELEQVNNNKKAS
jgi:phage antirepressor YoqD-like protein